MNAPKLHHYVPQFYLRRFVNSRGQLWVWDKLKDTIFQASPKKVAAENNFYWMHELADAGHDPNTMEKQLSHLEANVSMVTDQWLDWFCDLEPSKQIDIPEVNREEVALFIAVQFLRTLDTREVVGAFEKVDRADAKEGARLHTSLMWDLDVVRSIRDRIKKSIWIFGRNQTEAPFITSDNPVSFKTPDNRRWIRAGILSAGVYAVYPLSPDIVMYCYDRSSWEALSKFDGCLSPVQFSEQLVESDNCGQVFMANRFVFSQMNKFDKAKDFADAITTNRFAPKLPNVCE